MKTHGLFVTGTDTGVGKTVCSAALLAAAKSVGLNPSYMKPVQTGCATDSDLDYCAAAAGLRIDPKDRPFMVPYSFRPACSPHLAASKARIGISIAKIKKSFSRLCARHDFVVVEGAGGVLVPINNKPQTMLDVMVALKLPVVLVARPGLGTINHTWLSLDALRRAGLRVIAVLFSDTQSARWGYIEKDNLRTVRALGRVEECLRVPFMTIEQPRRRIAPPSTSSSHLEGRATRARLMATAGFSNDWKKSFDPRRFARRPKAVEGQFRLQGFPAILN